MTLTTRALCILASLLSGCALARDAGDGSEASLGTVESALATDIAVYTNTSLASPWQNWSWSSSVAFGNTTTPRLAGSTSQIKVTMQSAWGALSLARSTGNLTIADYDSIAFDVRGPASSTLYLSVETLAGSAGSPVVVPVTTTWTKKTISLAALKGSLTTFGKINLLGATAGQAFYIDNVRVIASAAPTSPTFPTAPITVTKNNVVALTSAAGPYSLFVPNAYDASHNTPNKLLLWLHGCGGDAYGDAWNVSPGGSQSWLTVSVGGRDGACWNVSTDGTLVLAALDDIKRRVNVDPRKVVIGGYSSGGDMAYRTAFYNANTFAGVLAENTSPFRDTGSSPSASIVAAGWKFNVAHLAHLSDATYPIAGVRTETDALTAAAFPMTRLERAGTHWDPNTAASGTDYDLRTYLLPFLDAGWSTP